ncbi:fatty acid desaturase [Paraburkholderia tropica]|uniref:fatty acid desaturase family protein n=1 Tax=Paraburkholderia tropica TaxID=92647 RepID=UPI0032B51A47
MDRATIGAAALFEIKNRPFKWAAIFLAKILVWVVWIGGCLYGLCTVHSMGATLALQAVLGAAYAHGVELQHQALHQSGFKSRSASRIFGIILGLPMLVSYSSYQDSHLFHHNKLGTVEDSEFFEYGDKAERRITSIFKHFFLVNHFCDFLKNVIDALNGRPFKTRMIARNSGKMRTEYSLMAAAFFGAAALAAHFDSDLFFRLWVLPLFVFAAPIHALIELPEHFRCNKATTDVFENTRSVKAHPIVTWFTNGNNYHVEHHWIASLPIEQLASIHKQIEGQIVHLSSSYPAFYREFFTNLLRGVVEPRFDSPLDDH